MGKFVLKNINFQGEGDFKQKNQIFVNKLILNNKDKLLNNLEKSSIQNIVTSISDLERKIALITSENDILQQLLDSALEENYGDEMKLFMNNVPLSIYFKDKESRLLKISNHLAKTVYQDREKVKDDEDKKQAFIQYRTFFQDIVGKIDSLTKKQSIELIFNTISSGKYTDKELFGEDEYLETIKQEDFVIETQSTFDNIETYDKHGLPKFMHTIKNPRRDAKGNIVGIFGVSIDISSQMKMQQELKTKNAELTAAEEELRQNLEELEATQEELQAKNRELIAMLELDTLFMDNISDNIFMKNVVCVDETENCFNNLKDRIGGNVNNLSDEDLDALSYKIDFRFEKISLSQARLLIGKEIACHSKLTDDIKKQIIDKTDFEFFDEKQSLKAFRDEVGIYITGKGLFNIEEELIDKKGKSTWVSVTKIPIKDKKGKVIRIIGIARDITEYKKMEKEMKYKSDTLDELLLNTKDTIYIKDENSRFIRNSDSWFTMIRKQLGDEGLFRTPENIVGKTDEGFFKKKEHYIDTFAKEQAMFYKARLYLETHENLYGFPKSDYIQDIEDHYDKNGDMIRIESIKRPILLDNKLCLMGISRDITESELQKEVLIQAKNKAEESDKLKSSFLANMSHEIRTPMNAVMGFSQLLEQEDITPQEKSMYINLIHQGGRRLLSLIDDILDFSKIESNTLKISKNNVSINKAAIEDVRNSVLMASKQKSFSKDKNINFINNLNGHNINVLGDINRINQILINIFSNAIKFVPEDFGEIKIDVLSQNNELKFSIRNNGPKISDNMIKKIFDSFVKEESTLNEGVGLGLSISRSLVELMGGKIWVENDENSENGVIFHFTLPLSN